MTEVDLIQVYLITVGSNQKNKNELTQCHYILILFQKQVCSKQVSLILLLFQSWCLVLYLQAFSDNSNLANLVDVQRLHENGKRIICISNGD